MQHGTRTNARVTQSFILGWFQSDKCSIFKKRQIENRTVQLLTSSAHLEEEGKGIEFAGGLEATAALPRKLARSREEKHLKHKRIMGSFTRFRAHSRGSSKQHTMRGAAFVFSSSFCTSEGPIRRFLSMGGIVLCFCSVCAVDLRVKM